MSATLADTQLELSETKDRVRDLEILLIAVCKVTKIRRKIALTGAERQLLDELEKEVLDDVPTATSK